MDKKEISKYQAESKRKTSQCNEDLTATQKQEKKNKKTRKGKNEKIRKKGNIRGSSPADSVSAAPSHELFVGSSRTSTIQK